MIERPYKIERQGKYWFAKSPDDDHVLYDPETVTLVLWGCRVTKSGVEAQMMTQQGVDEHDITVESENVECQPEGTGFAWVFTRPDGSLGGYFLEAQDAISNSENES